ncbi:MAG: TlyA family RNA methyltransferase [Desulfobacterales bacterium]|jgi:23S rRNA (cytidine1920-2'-O)/16S rRNA (cytidine1409-2'-O)-methyltransferase|nr:TlyA family RNA methyltransferase [Desulfobacterales bacterium]MDP6806617.1 TlyA family RNA methyltransferase [Desulfobacterales bacterium]|tara:strand:+ start:43899 stop:44645 length:747 start_codon:yes stop_codon:yes gene_type:complete
MPVTKIRLDQMIVEKGLAQSRQSAKTLIMAGNILVNNQPLDKPGTLVSSDKNILVKGGENRYVSRGGLKIERALKAFKIDVSGFDCLDVGASTGGFTDCLLQHGAARIFAVDVGYGQLAWKLRQDPRVHVIERTNIRHMPIETISRPVDLITIDVSFISLKIVVPEVIQFTGADGAILALIKPQFEVGKGNVGKGGVVKSPALHRKVIDDLSTFFTKEGLVCKPIIPSALLGPKGNKEFFIYLRRFEL